MIAAWLQMLFFIIPGVVLSTIYLMFVQRKDEGEASQHKSIASAAAFDTGNGGGDGDENHRPQLATG